MCARTRENYRFFHVASKYTEAREYRLQREGNIFFSCEFRYTRNYAPRVHMCTYEKRYYYRDQGNRV